VGRSAIPLYRTALLSVRVVLLGLAAGRPRLLKTWSGAFSSMWGRHRRMDDTAGGRRGPAGQRLDRRNGLRSWTIVWPGERCTRRADRFLRVHDGSGTQKTYAYYPGRSPAVARTECLVVRDVGAGPGALHGRRRSRRAHAARRVVRDGKRPYGRRRCRPRGLLKGFPTCTSRPSASALKLGEALDRTRCRHRGGPAVGAAGAREDGDARRTRWRRRAGTGAPKMLPGWCPDDLLAVVSSARDRLIVSWLADGACGSASCAVSTSLTCTLRRDAAAGSAGGRTCTCATGRGTRTGPRPRPGTRGGPMAAR